MAALLRLWRGDLPLATAFWSWAVTGGLLVNLIDLYDKPSVVAEISGEGQIKDFGVDIKLATDGLPRVTGRVSASGAPGPAGTPANRARHAIRPPPGARPFPL